MNKIMRRIFLSETDLLILQREKTARFRQNHDLRCFYFMSRRTRKKARLKTALEL